MSKKCKFYDEWTWGEPPLEPDGKGRLITEYECKNATGYFVPMCGGNKKFCGLPDKQNKQLLKRKSSSV
jgi:hypothetical protein